MNQVQSYFLVILLSLMICNTVLGIGRGNGKRSQNSTGGRTTSTTWSNIRNMIPSEPEEVKSNGDKPKSRPGISAWGIIALIISLILLCMGTYYSVLFYPLFCTKERKYDIIDLSPA